MSCHYSCLTCSSPIYADLCLSCPLTRTLTDTSCICSSNYYQYQSQTCVSKSSLSPSDFNLITSLQIIYYIMIILSWFHIILNLNHVYSSKLRTIITFVQLTGLIKQYRFRLSYMQEWAVDIFGVWNFSYFNNISCNSKSKPYLCENYENVIGPLIILAVFILLYFLSFIITKSCINRIPLKQGQIQQNPQMGDIVVIRGRSQTYFNQSTQFNIKFIDYIKITFNSFLLIYIDHTIISTTIQICRIAQKISKNHYYLAYIFYIPLSFLLLCFIFYLLKTINSPLQFNIQYRSKNGYFFLYDQNYHLSYLNYLFEQQKQSKNNKNYQTKRFIPHSNYLVFEIFMKFILSMTTILLFQYKPYVFALAIFGVMIGVFLKLEVFQVYERGNLAVYFCSAIIYLIMILGFYTRFFVIYVVIVAFVSSGLILMVQISTLIDWNANKQGKYYAIAFQCQNDQNLQEQQNIVVSQENAQNNLQQTNNQLIKGSRNTFDKLSRNSNNFSKNKLKLSSKRSNLTQNQDNPLNITNNNNKNPNLPLESRSQKRLSQNTIKSNNFLNTKKQSFMSQTIRSLNQNKQKNSQININTQQKINETKIKINPLLPEIQQNNDEDKNQPQ